jgi:hypothetical protein
MYILNRFNIGLSQHLASASSLRQEPPSRLHRGVTDAGGPGGARAGARPGGRGSWRVLRLGGARPWWGAGVAGGGGSTEDTRRWNAEAAGACWGPPTTCQALRGLARGLDGAVWWGSRRFELGRVPLRWEYRAVLEALRRETAHGCIRGIAAKPASLRANGSGCVPCFLRSAGAHYVLKLSKLPMSERVFRIQEQQK